MAKKHRNPSQTPTQAPQNTAKNRSHKAQKPSPTVAVLDKKQARREAKHLGLNKADLPNSIKEIIATLTEAGYEAYIVGGGVRDALLGLRPKDFDAVTNATPSQIKDVFGKRCRIIGRRFLLCHVYSGRDMIEVATFRAPPKDDTFTTEDGMLTRDNVWGNIYQDAVRRDFSINALYYQPLEGFVYDFCGGLNDVQNKTLRLLGDAKTRIEEDPVRLLRALRFKAKLGFRFSSDLEKQFNNENWALIAQVSPHRLYDETQKMFTGGYLVPLLPLLFDYQAFKHLIFYPPTAITPLVERVAINTDKRINEGKSINPAFFYASILWENYLFLLEKFKKNMPFAEAQHHSANKVMDKQRNLTAMPKFAEQFIKDVWLMQPRLAEPRRKNIVKLTQQERFRAGYDFLHLREMVQNQPQNDFSPNGTQSFDTDSTNNMGAWWAWYQTLSAKQQQQAIAEFDLEKVKQRFGNVYKAENGKAKGKIQKTRLSQQEQGEKDQLRQLSLATPSSGKTPKPLWETPEMVEETVETVAKSMGGYDLEDFSTPRQSRRERRLANQALREQTQKTELNSVKDKPRSTKNATEQASRLVEQAVPPRRQRREPSSELSVLEKAVIEKTLLEKGESLKPVSAKEKPNATTAETQTVAKKPRTRKAKIAETVIEPTVEMVETVANVATTKPKTTRKSKAKTEPKAVETVESETVESKAIKLTAEPLPTTEILPTKIPAKRSRKKVVETVAIQTTESQAEKVAEKITETVTEKPVAKRGRKPKVVAENVEVLPVKAEKIPAKRTRKKAVE